MPQNYSLQPTMRTGNMASGPEKLYILVMGLTGAGKSTIIKDLTGNPNIPIGTAADLHRVTDEVQDYVLLYACQGTTYEVHLIDSPGFDDNIIGDVKVLESIASYVNITYKLKERLAGVLYLHDISKAKMGGVGQRNIRMLEQMIGLDKFKNCCIVTTKWDITNFQDAKARENTLQADKDFFGSMLQTGQLGHNAALCRYSPKTKECALKIIRPYLKNKFTTNISKQMVSPRGPKLPLGKTGAGKLVAENLEELARLQEENEQLHDAKLTLAKRFDEALFEEFRRDSRKLRHKITLQRSGRWIMRTTLVGGAIVATVLTLGPGAAAFALEPAYEKAVRGQRTEENRAKAKMEAEFKEKSKGGTGLLSAISPDWLWNSKIKSMEDLNSEGYSIKSQGSEDQELRVAKMGATVGVAAEGEMAMEDVILGAKEIADDSVSEDSEWSDDGSILTTKRSEHFGS